MKRPFCSAKPHWSLVWSLLGRTVQGKISSTPYIFATLELGFSSYPEVEVHQFSSCLSKSRIWLGDLSHDSFSNTEIILIYPNQNLLKLYPKVNLWCKIVSRTLSHHRDPNSLHIWMSQLFWRKTFPLTSLSFLCVEASAPLLFPVKSAVVVWKSSDWSYSKPGLD